MMENNQTLFIKELLELVKRDSPNIRISQTCISDWSFFNLIEDSDPNIISNKVYTGFHRDPSVALQKSISEYFERKAFLRTQYSSSDGFAAYPSSPNHILGREQARKNALNEATERYVWAKWWDDNTAAKIEKYNKNHFYKFKSLIDLIDQYIPCRNIYLIKPSFRHSLNFPLIETMMIFWESKENGFICAGASGNPTDETSTLERVFAELIRHAIAAHRAKKQSMVPRTFYEKRLCFFANGYGDDLVHLRLNKFPRDFIQLPVLDIDRPVDHEYSDRVSVHHCLYRDQPQFLSGKVERFCI